ncbi:thiamine phosphate synthase [Pontibacter sp. E15-1]|uniref:thiamine phosphate synthase n=1 Tax=Pontibacter sp. E15-1 TaxID=2919918 RepID=UPI001F4F5776|nr:thiamine phosphate synthase [Pontibacter sp. E15-1]MCJ8165130.1 thiamine phosphate synthase [Pontibacter sp. E15-1]
MDGLSGECGMELIVITSPERVGQEQQVCCQLFALGLQTLHVRKPGATLPELRNWLQLLPERYHRHIMLHTHHALAQEFAVKGLHFRETERAATATTEKGRLIFSSSFHTLGAVQQPQPYLDYAFLSPVFQSISKKDYPAAFTSDDLKAALPKATLPLVALGGITAEKLPLVQNLGFAGAAVLGAVWGNPEPVQAYRRLLQFREDLTASARPVSV